MTRFGKGSAVGDQYTQLEVVVNRVLDRSIIVKNDEAEDGETVIGKSLLSITSEELIDSEDNFPVTLDLEIKTWVLRKEGLI